MASGQSAVESSGGQFMFEVLKLFAQVVNFGLEVFFDLLEFFAADIGVFHDRFEIGEAVRQKFILFGESGPDFLLDQWAHLLLNRRAYYAPDGLEIALGEGHIALV